MKSLTDNAYASVWQWHLLVGAVFRSQHWSNCCCRRLSIVFVFFQKQFFFFFFHIFPSNWNFIVIPDLRLSVGRRGDMIDRWTVDERNTDWEKTPNNFLFALFVKNVNLFFSYLCWTAGPHPPTLTPTPPHPHPQPLPHWSALKDLIEEFSDFQTFFVHFSLIKKSKWVKFLFLFLLLFFFYLHWTPVQTMHGK